MLEGTAFPAVDQIRAILPVAFVSCGFLRLSDFQTAHHPAAAGIPLVVGSGDGDTVAGKAVAVANSVIIAIQPLSNRFFRGAFARFRVEIATDGPGQVGPVVIVAGAELFEIISLKEAPVYPLICIRVANIGYIAFRLRWPAAA